MVSAITHPHVPVFGMPGNHLRSMSSRCTCVYSKSVAERLSSRQQRAYSVETLAAPVPEGDSKEYPPKLHEIVNEISQLTLLEVADLNELLKVSALDVGSRDSFRHGIGTFS